jgi:hypothetical protein
MKRIGSVGLCLIAAFVLSAFVAASASAAGPEYVTCGKAAKVSGKYTGKYSEKKCEKEATTAEQEEGKKNKYERDPLTKKEKFTAANVGVGKLFVIDPTTEPPGEIAAEVACEKEKVKGGEITSATTEKWSAVYTGCTGKAPSYHLEGKCESAKAKEGEIKTEELEGTLTYLSSTEPKTVGVRVKAASGSKYIARFTCIAEIVGLEVVGEALIERKGDVEALSKTAEDVGKAGTDHGQDPYYEEEAHSEAEAFTYFDFGYCVAEEEKKGLSEAEAEAVCSVKVKVLPTELHEPVSFLAHTFGSVGEKTAPVTEVATSKIKGAALMIRR